MMMMSKNGISAGWCALLYAVALVSLVSTARAQGSSEMQDLTLGTPGTGQFVVGYDSTDTGDDPAGTAKRYAFPPPAWAMTGQSLTGSQSTSLLDLATTWNTTGTPTALKLNVTDTASNASGLLMDLQVGGVSKFKVTKSGTVTVANFDVAGDVTVKNGTSAVEQTIYNTYTDASNYEGLEIGFKDSLNVATIKTTANGTGTVRPIVFKTGGTERIRINANGKIGVGTTVPNYLYQQDTANGTDNWIGIRQAAQALWSMGMKAGYGTFHVRSGNAGSEIDHMSITYNTGNVGIGTTSPGSKLDVAGGVTLRDRSAMTADAAQSKIWSQSGEMKVIDASGNVTTISPHPQELMDVLGVTGAAKTLGMDYTTPESGFAVAQPKAQWLEWYVEIDHTNGSWTKRNFNGNEIESGQSNDLIK
jgi:hypothetical protein